MTHIIRRHFIDFSSEKTFISNRVHVEKIIKNFVVVTIIKQKVLGCFVTLSIRENNRKDESKNADDCSIGKGLDLLKSLINFHPWRPGRDESTYLQRECPTQISNRDGARSSIISCKSQAVKKVTRFDSILSTAFKKNTSVLSLSMRLPPKKI